MRHAKLNLLHDIALLAFSIIIAILLLKTGILHATLAKTQEYALLGSFIAGIFFASIFTVAISVVTFVELAQEQNILLIALAGGAGAVIGDLVIFTFVRDRLSVHLARLLHWSRSPLLRRILRNRFSRFLLPLIGALIIASPFPDELGLTLMGISGMRTTPFVFLAFAMNTLGILVIGLFSRWTMA